MILPFGISVEGDLDVDVVPVPMDMPEMEDKFDLPDEVDSIDARRVFTSAGCDGLLGGKTGPTDSFLAGSLGGGDGLGVNASSELVVRWMLGGGKTPFVLAALGSLPICRVTAVPLCRRGGLLAELRLASTGGLAAEGRGGCGGGTPPWDGRAGVTGGRPSAGVRPT